MPLKWLWMLTTLAVPVLPISAQTPESAQPAVAVQGEPIRAELKELGAATVVILEHQGPYWRMGPLFRELGELASSRGQTGAMFTRYLDEPGTTTAQELRAEVGFFADDSIEVQEPFRVERWPARRVAVLTVEGRYGRTPNQYERLRRWVGEHDYKVAGPMTEVYVSPGNGGARLTEIRLPVSTGDAIVPEPPAGSEAEPDRPEAPDTVPPPVEQAPHSAEVIQLLLRLDALRQAVDSFYPDQAAVVNTYLAPVLTRSGMLNKTRALPAPDLDKRGAGTPQCYALAAKLDALLANVALRRLQPAELTRAAAEIAGEVDDLVEAEKIQRR